MSHGDSDKPNFKDLDFLNLDPIHGDPSADMEADDLVYEKDGADALMGLDAAASESDGSEPVAELSVEEQAGSPIEDGETGPMPADAESTAAPNGMPNFEEDPFAAVTDYSPGNADGFGDTLLATSSGLMAFEGAASGITSSEHAENEAALESTENPEPEPTEQGKFAAFITSLSESNPYSVILGMAFAAILLGCTLLLVEWWRYEFTTSKDSIKERVNRGPRAAVQFVEPIPGEIRAA